MARTAAPKWPDATQTTLTRLKGGDRIVVMDGWKPDQGQVVPVLNSDKASCRAQARVVTVVRTQRVQFADTRGYKYGLIEVTTDDGYIEASSAMVRVLVLPKET